jgi:hypothetical protein
VEPSELDTRVAAFLRDLALAWRHQAMYPAGHPNREGGVRSTRASLEALLALTGPLEIGVLGDALLVRGDRVTTPNAARIAARLTDWRVALIAFDPGVGDDDVAKLLSRLSDDPRRAAEERFADALAGGGSGAIRIGEIDYGALALVDPGSERDSGRAGIGGRSVWQSVVETLLAGRILGGEEWSVWIGRGGDAEGVIGHLVGGGGEGGKAAGRAMARAWISSPAAERTATAPRVARILSRLPREARGPILEALARRAAELDPEGSDAAALVAALPTEEAIATLRRLAAAPGGLSGRLAALAQELGSAARAEAGSSAVELLNDLRGRFADGDIDSARPAPELPEPDPPAWDVGFRLDDPALAPLSEALSEQTPLLHATQTALELAAIHDDPETLGPLAERFESSFRALVLGTRLRPAIDLVERLQRLAADPDRPDEARRILAGGLDRMASREGIASLVEVLGELSGGDVEASRRLVEVLGGGAVHSLLVALAEEEGRSRRHHLLDFIVSLGDRAIAPATALLTDARWYVVRNMLLLLRQIGDRSSLPQVRRLAVNADLRVKLEAIRSLFALDREPPTELLAAVIHDPDAKLAEAAVTLAGARGFLEAAAPLTDLLRPWDPFGRRRALRLRALKALGQLGAPAALPRLERFARRFNLAPIAIEERRAFFQSLGGYPAEARAPYVARGLTFPDPAIREICRRLAASERAG